MFAALGEAIPWQELHSHADGYRTAGSPQDSAASTRATDRFARTQIRPEQQAFREAVYEACGGRCVITGCDIPEVLEACHIAGSSWREGHNDESYGILLRRDLHALYDKGLMRIKSGGQISVESTACPDYDGLRTEIARFPSAVRANMYALEQLLLAALPARDSL